MLKKMVTVRQDMDTCFLSMVFPTGYDRSQWVDPYVCFYI